LGAKIPDFDDMNYKVRIYFGEKIKFIDNLAGRFYDSTQINDIAHANIWSHEPKGYN
jgi:hypothetical protein